MREIRKEVCHSAAFEVDNEKCNVIRAELNSKREDIGLESFTLS